MGRRKIKLMLENSNFNNPVIIRTKYGFTKFWQDKGIKYLSWGKNWIDKNPLTIDPDSASEIILQNNFGLNIE